MLFNNACPNDICYIYCSNRWNNGNIGIYCY